MFLGDLIQSRHPCHDRRGCSRTSRHTKIADLWKYCRWVLLLHLGPRRLLYTVAVGIIQELLWLMCAFANSILHSAATSGLRWALDDDLLLGVEVSQWTQPVFLTGTTALNRKYCMDLFFGGYVFVCCRRFCLGAGDAIDVVLFYLYFCDLAVVVRCQWLIFFCKILLFICASFLYLATSVAQPNRKWMSTGELLPTCCIDIYGPKRPMWSVT